LENGLVDKLGHFQDAIIAAATAAGVNPEQTTFELVLLGRGDFPLKQGFQALIAPSAQHQLTRVLLKKMGLSQSEMSFWLSDGTKAHLPYKIVVE
jgi:ClpP class serine protease